MILIEACEKGQGGEVLNRLAQVEKYLDRQGVVPCTKFYTYRTEGIAEELFKIAKGEATGLIVAGAYGHSRFGEWIFGGVTHDLLTTSPVCCLLSH